MSSPPRIASLVPSITELLVALGLGPRLVARTGFCIHPQAALAEVPKVGGTKDVNLAKLRKLAPTHVIVNVDENRLELVEALREFVPHMVVTHPQGPEDNLALLAQMELHFGGQPGVTEQCARLGAELRLALQRCRSEVWPTQRVLYLIWREPWMTVARDTYIARMLAEVGWQSWPAVLGGESGAARYPALQEGEAWLSQIDRVLLSSEPYRFDASHFESAQALCPQAKVQLIDGELLSWYGPRAARGLDYLRALAS
ncbi:helical backbone metal receptor [Roseateles oligotrophus]|uniref:Helical backbone metal receptor n=1 Tax=Roseateles oligotrophus TaxID=1769250 RepID=A0ABT2YL47_9BURK|nr:helical backbone metal receptor [Roseateles oligotrophus]MCV2370666.1 helical backbone metal receptor [Roseateles oligotrophus]